MKRSRFNEEQIIAILREHEAGANPFDCSRPPPMVLGLDFPNPIGLAAGFDKNAEGLVRKIKQELVQLLERDGINSINAAVGRDVA